MCENGSCRTGWTSPAGPPTGLAMVDPIEGPHGQIQPDCLRGARESGALVKSFNAVLKYISYDNLT